MLRFEKLYSEPVVCPVIDSSESPYAETLSVPVHSHLGITDRNGSGDISQVAYG